MPMIPAQATQEHATHFANFAQLASDNLFTELLGGRANHILAELFYQPDNDNSYQFTHFLLDGDDIVGMINGWTATDKHTNNGNNDRLMRRYAGWRYLRYMAIGIYLMDVLEFIGANLSEGDFYIQMVAIYSQYRGRGHSKSLLAHAQELAIAQGCRRLVLDVDSRNTVAISAYRKVGFDVIDESKKRTDDGVRWGMLRMGQLTQDAL